jgi:uncharacterized tellurite resistance protein B-like protein
MFADFLKRLITPEPDPLDDGDASLALCALLVRIARADGDFSADERRQINSVITTRYVLDREGAAKLLSDADELETQAPDTVRFTRAIKDAVPYEERLSVIEALWSVVLADGVRAEEEDALLRLVANLLGVNDKDSALARQRVAAAE